MHRSNPLWSHAGAEWMGLYNTVLLRRWRASMDLQVVKDGYAVCKYILGYVLKAEADVHAQRQFEAMTVMHMRMTLAMCV